METDITASDIRIILDTACRAAGGLRAWSREHGLSAPYVSDVMRGNRPPGGRIAAALGFAIVRTETRYRRLGAATEREA